MTSQRKINNHRAELHIVEMQLSSIKPYEQNCRKHSQKEIDQLISSIAEVGFVVPILVDEEKIILAGHKRYAAAHQMGMAVVPVIQLEGLTDATKRAFRIWDNQATLQATWDEEKLIAELTALQGMGFDLKPLGLEELLPHEFNPTDLTGSFTTSLLGCSDERSYTFTYPAEEATPIDTFIKEHGKAELQQAILRLCTQGEHA